MPRRHSRLLLLTALLACAHLTGCGTEEPGGWPGGELTGAVADDPATPTGNPGHVDPADGLAIVRFEFTEAVRGVHEVELVLDLDDATCADGAPARPQDIRVGAVARVDHEPSDGVEDMDPHPLRATAVELDCDAP